MQKPAAIFARAALPAALLAARMAALMAGLMAALLVVGSPWNALQAQSPAQRTYRIGATIVVVGHDDTRPGHELYRVTSAKWRPAGVLIVANSGTSEVRVFNQSGVLKNTLGSAGEGPGEFRGLESVWLAGRDTLITFDPLSWRLTYWLDSGRGPLHDVAVSAIDDGDLVGRFADGTYAQLRVTHKARPPQGAADLDSIVVARYDAARNETTDLGRYPYLTKFTAVMPNGVKILTPLTLFPKTLIANNAGTLFVGYPDRWSFDAYATNANSRRMMRPAIPLTPFTRALRSAWADSLIKFLPSDAGSAEKFVNSLAYPTNLPAFDTMLADDIGNLWVRQFHEPGATTARWFIFTPDGKTAATLTLPASMRVMQAGKDFIVTVEGGADKNEEVKVIQLIR